MSTISFKANPMMQVSVKKLDNNKYAPAKATLVELCPDNANDLSCLDDVSGIWKETFAYGIWHDAYQQHVNGHDEKEKTHFYAVTEQNKDFEKLNPNKILGLVEFKKNDGKHSNEIVFLQTNPKNISHHKSKNKPQNIFAELLSIFSLNKSKTEYKSIGSSIINSLKTLFPNEDIFLYSAEWAQGFYKKQGFKKCPQKDKGFMLLKNV